MADVPFIVVSLLVILLNIIPLAWQFKHKNSGPVCLGVWVLIANLNALVRPPIEYIHAG